MWAKITLSAFQSPLLEELKENRSREPIIEYWRVLLGRSLSLPAEAWNGPMKQIFEIDQCFSYTEVERESRLFIPSLLAEASEQEPKGEQIVISFSRVGGSQ